jgi:hypothetical protein
MCSCRHAACKLLFRICLLHLAGLSSSLQRQERSPEQLPAAACRLTGRRLRGCQRSDGCTAGGSNQFQLPPAICIMYVFIASNQMQSYCMMIMLVHSPAASGVRSNAVTRRAPQGRHQKQLLATSAARGGFQAAVQTSHRLARHTCLPGTQQQALELLYGRSPYSTGEASVTLAR